MFSCDEPERVNIDFTEWGNYWFQGKAEISSFDLVQYRYGEAREGEAVLIFVTEDFSRKKQVKLDEPEKAGRDKMSVLKMNQTRDFVTGIYPYHMMLSAFTPTQEKSYGLKFTASSQEWCGQTFTQLNKNGEASYQGKLFSYFEHDFPFPILEWKEIQTKANGEKEITQAKRKAIKIIDYWKRNKLEDEFLREELNLKF